MSKLRGYLTESSLSRLWEHNESHDCGVITAFRNYTNCGYMDTDEPCFDNKPPEKISKSENSKRNKALMADLIKDGFKGSTKLVGSYPEGGKQTKEISYFVVDLEDIGDLRKILMKLGHKYDQDSILFIPKGSIQGLDKAFLIGTNKCPNNDIKTGETMIFNKGRVGYESPFYTSYVNGRPMIFEMVSCSDGLGFSSGTSAIMASKFSGEYGQDYEQT